MKTNLQKKTLRLELETLNRSFVHNKAVFCRSTIPKFVETQNKQKEERKEETKSNDSQ